MLKNRRGDCTEFAILLAALAQAEGIRTRRVTGMVCADRHAGALRVYVPRAWGQSRVDGRRKNDDAARRQFDSTQIALTVGNGDPPRYIGATRWLGQMTIDGVRPTDEFTPPDSPPSGRRHLR
ncbi:MAG: hypothetical protein KGN77_10925 [Xanthomonadaceae bacterium]|nr:hypothetical protein [Xanthomonadaceae bacterium]